ncbi:DMT family transporter [Prauserella cavernicola]|uniref:DMT family transporter n=1 Tax=Prauserella cavernicola TaxID=2800127 RepID=A0A934V2U9_9PSEU|nr:DMT family transporter [Prauserella cavernicola]MBK1783552.1 DMT family transporter [Prauserella cavernicola]
MVNPRNLLPPVLTGSPAAWVALGAGSLSVSAVLIALADVSAATAAFYRCVLALVLLAPLLVRELRRHGPVGPAMLGTALVGGAFLGLDFLLWNVSIGDVGAGISTVLVNLQVVLFPLVMRVLAGVPLARRFLVALPVLLLGVALAGGVVGTGGVGGNPVRGTVFALLAALAYSGYLYFSRDCGERFPRHLVTLVFTATASAAAVAGVAGVATTGISVDLPLRAWVCLALVALFGQALGWLLIGAGLPRLAPALSSTLLLLQPAGATLLGALVLDEVPSVTQFAGCVTVLATVWLLASGRSRRHRTEREAEPAPAAVG